MGADLLPGQRRRSLLSHEDSPFVGRLHELGLVRGAVAEGRLVTLSGEAGIGKTRLAQHFANEQRSAYETAGGVWFCDLRDARDAEAMCSTLARTLNIADEATIVGDGAVTAVGRALATRGRALVVLHALARAAREQRVLRSRHRDPPRPSRPRGGPRRERRRARRRAIAAATQRLQAAGRGDGDEAPPVRRSDDARIAVRILRRAIDATAR